MLTRIEPDSDDDLDKPKHDNRDHDDSPERGRGEVEQEGAATRCEQDEGVDEDAEGALEKEHPRRTAGILGAGATIAFGLGAVCATVTIRLP